MMQCFAQGQHKGLGGVVHRHAGSRQKARDRSHIENAAFVTFKALDVSKRQRGEGDVGGDGDGNGGEVEDAANAGRDELVGDVLGVIGGDGDDGQTNCQFLNCRF